MDEVEQFIKRRFPDDCNWLSGNCYWFATILVLRFPELEYYYDPIIGHFYAGNGKIFYDWTGRVAAENIQPLRMIFMDEPQWYERLMRDCMM